MWGTHPSSGNRRQNPLEFYAGGYKHGDAMNIDRIVHTLEE